jgi:hypothetical protein
VVVDVVVVRIGSAHPVTGTVVAAESVDGGHNKGTDVVVVVVVVVVAPETESGVKVNNAVAAIGRTTRRRRTLDTLLMMNAHDWALQRRY